ncbi:MAG: PKD domain-containing protein, partial [Kiritimatiellae bacterium]|nr:PKD domain-containing protein [Kiritimatiellia bacterium]
MPEMSSCYGDWDRAGNGVVYFIQNWFGYGPATMAPTIMGVIASVEDEENTMQYRMERSKNRIEETPVKRVGVNFGGAVDQYLYEEGMLWTHHPAMFRLQEVLPMIPVTYRGAVTRRYHQSAQMEPFGSSPKSWVYASNVAGMDGMSVHLIQPVVARTGYSAPAVDGALSDACWDGANRLNIVVNHDYIDYARNGGPNLPKADDHAYAMLRYDSANLYVAAGIHAAFPTAQPGAKYVKIALASRENPGNVIVLNCDAVSGKSSTGLETGLWTGVSRTDGVDPFTAELAIPWSAVESAGLWKEQMLVNIEICGWALKANGRLAPHTATFLETSNYFTPLYLDAARGSSAVAKPHTVKLYFAEMEGLSGGQRIFDVKLQGQTVLSNLDVAAQAGGGRRGLLKEFTNVMIADKLDIDFTRKAGDPMLSGVEIDGTYTDFAENVPPVAQIDSDRVSGSSPLTVNFSAQDSYDDDGQIVDCRWNFGDGVMAWGSTASHIYAEPGTYTVSLMVLDSRGAAGSATTTITVSAGAVSAFVCGIRASGGDYATLTAWETAIQSDLTASGSLLFTVSSRGSYAAADDGTVVTFTGGSTGILKHINGANVAYITGCSGTIQTGTVTCASGRAFSVSNTGVRINRAIAEGYNDWPTTGLADILTLSGWVTDADHGVTLRSAAGHAHNGVLKNASSQYTGFALKGGAYNVDAIVDSIGNVSIEGIIDAGGRIKLGAGSSANRVIVSNGSIYVGIGGTVANCMGVNCSFGVGSVQFVTFNAAFINCTSVNWSWTAFSPGTSNKRIRFVNCLAKPASGGKGFDSNEYPELNPISYCASSDGTADDWEIWNSAGRQANQANRVFTFVNASSNDYRLADTDPGARGLGTAGFGADIEGQTRQEPYDIGADEVSSGGNISPMAMISATPTSGIVPLAVSFSGASS